MILIHIKAGLPDMNWIKYRIDDGGIMNKEVKRINMAIKILMYLFIANAISSTMSMTIALVLQEASVMSYVLKCLVSTIYALMLAFICSRTKIVVNEEESKTED